MRLGRSMVSMLCVAAAAQGLLAGCGGGGSTQTLAPRSQAVTHQVSDTDGGGTVSARVGDQIVVTLHSTYWQVSDPAGSVLVLEQQPQATAGGPSCSSIPGSGCGTVTAAFRVAAAGSTRIEAERQSCGEAMRCTGDQGRWSVKVVATS